MKGVQSYKTPGMPNQGIVSPGKDDPKISEEEPYVSISGRIVTAFGRALKTGYSKHSLRISEVYGWSYFSGV
jgi:hypothetical protein